MNNLSVVTVPRSTEVEVIEAREAWSEYRLADGTTLRVKPVMITVSRVEDAETVTGEPVYTMKSTLITDVKGAKPPANQG